VLGVVTRARMRSHNLRHRAVFLAIVDDGGRLLVHRRSDDKDVWPGWWDLAVGGVVHVGESYDAAAVRELEEELGLHGVATERLGDGHYEDDRVRLLGRVYLVRHNGPFEYADGEVVEACWVTLAELNHRLARDDFLPDSRALVLPLLAAREDVGPTGQGKGDPV